MGPTMPESHKAEKRRIQKANRAAGIGDENGRIPARVKNEATLLRCFICQQEMKVTKTNTELKQHAENKHGKTLAECFPKAECIAIEMVKALEALKKEPKGKAPVKGKKKKGGDAEGLDDLLSAGLTGGTKKKGKGRK